jgi:hypothetical protein
MTPGMLTTSNAALPFGTGIVIFNEENQRQIVIKMNTKAAQAAGIGALAQRAIDTGDYADALEFIASLAVELAEGLQHLASVAGQLKASKAA